MRKLIVARNVRFSIICLLLLAKDVRSIGDGSANSLEHRIQGILDDVREWKDARKESGRPFTTLTFAQSLDGKIALVGDSALSASTSNLPLSGNESLLLTHALRSIHDAILIGGETLSIDNPRLTNRLWGGASTSHQPRPVVLDMHLKHLRKLGSQRRASKLIVCCSKESAAEAARENDISLLSSVELLPCQSFSSRTLNLHDVVKQLKEKHGINSIMVEGGAKVLTSFVYENLADCICITIAPKLIGNQLGLAGISTIGSKATDMWIDMSPLEPKFVKIGADCVFLSKWPK